jgi:single-stranded-DNA-specific exonuclease
MKITFKHEIKADDKIDSEKLIDLILQSRKIANVSEFLDPPSPLNISLFDFDKKYSDSFKKVIGMLKEIKKENQMIVVYTDYDADGITGGAILWETLNLLGFKAMPYVPDRKTEGYGFSIKGIDNIISQFDPALVISVDHGITKVKEIAYAASKSIKVIVTDHHLKGEKIPDKAEAVFHIPALSGSGVSYFFSKEIFNFFKDKSENKDILAHNFSVDYLALASIGTVADLVPLTGYSRSVVKHGLEAFSRVRRHGIKQILKQAGIEDKPVTPYEIGFMIAPRINAIGRLRHAIDALRLLCTKSETKAHELAQLVSSINVERQALVEKSVKEAEALVPKKLKKIIILSTDHWNEGIIGLIASKLVEKFFRPVIIMTKNDGFYKGSARSIPSFHMTDFLKSLKEHLVDAGGHAAAAGFTIEKEKLKEFIIAAEKKAESQIKDKDLERDIIADIKIPVSKITIKLIESLKLLEPYGIGNPRPVFLSNGVITGASLFGKTSTHLKIFVDGLEFIAFSKATLLKNFSRGEKIDIVYNPEVNEWMSHKKLQGRITNL